VVQTTTTDANGNYTFNNVPAGTYTVVETNKPGYLDVGDIDGGNPNSITVTLPAGTSSTGNDFLTSAPPPSATRCGWTRTPTACRTPVKPVLPVSPSSCSTAPAPWWPPPPPMPTATTSSVT
jgi:hypothetical protein